MQTQHDDVPVSSEHSLDADAESPIVPPVIIEVEKISSGEAEAKANIAPKLASSLKVIALEEKKEEEIETRTRVVSHSVEPSPIILELKNSLQESP